MFCLFLLPFWYKVEYITLLSMSAQSFSLRCPFVHTMVPWYNV